MSTRAELIAALRAYRQFDDDGVMVIVSRQACEEAAEFIEATRTAIPDLQPTCQHCNDTGFVIIRSDYGTYVRPGPLPDDAKGYAESPCWHCNTYPGGFDGPTGAE